MDRYTKPTFIGIGAQKSGTTWIAACLAAHPDVFITYPKELNFFNSSPGHQFVNEIKNWDRGLAWYESNFVEGENYPVRGEFSVLYMPDQQAAENIARAYPEVKIITSLRHPLRRAVSAYAHLKRLSIMYANFPINKVSDSLIEAAKKVPGLVEFGKYKSQMELYLKLFGPENVKIVLYDDIESNPVEVMQNIYDFLAIDRGFIPGNIGEKRNPRSIPRFELVEKSLHNVSSSLSNIGMNEFVKWVKRMGLPDKIRAWNAGSDDIQLVKRERQSMLQMYAEDIDWVETYLDRDLAHWRSW